MYDIRNDIVQLLPRMRRLAWAIARSHHDAEDLLQLTVERALERSDSWEPGTRLDWWIFRIMKNLWIDHTRKTNRWGRLVEYLPDGAEISDHGAAADEILDSVELGRIRELVESLPEEQRMAVRLVLLGGHSYTEAAAILEVPQGTLTSRLARGRMALARHFQNERTRH